MKKLMNFFMLSCKKASGLIVKRESFNLTLTEKIRLHLHLLMCDACAAFSGQSKMIHQVMEQENDHAGDIPEANEPPENLKEKILSTLK